MTYFRRQTLELIDCIYFLHGCLCIDSRATDKEISLVKIYMINKVISSLLYSCSHIQLSMSDCCHQAAKLPCTKSLEGTIRKIQSAIHPQRSALQLLLLFSLCLFQAAFAEHREGEGREWMCFNGGAVRGGGAAVQEDGGRRRRRQRVHQQCSAWGD